MNWIIFDLKNYNINLISNTSLSRTHQLAVPWSRFQFCCTYFWMETLPASLSLYFDLAFISSCLFSEFMLHLANQVFLLSSYVLYGFQDYNFWLAPLIIVFKSRLSALLSLLILSSHIKFLTTTWATSNQLQWLMELPKLSFIQETI